MSRSCSDTSTSSTLIDPRNGCRPPPRQRPVRQPPQQPARLVARLPVDARQLPDLDRLRARRQPLRRVQPQLLVTAQQLLQMPAAGPLLHAPAPTRSRAPPPPPPPADRPAPRRTAPPAPRRRPRAAPSAASSPDPPSHPPSVRDRPPTGGAVLRHSPILTQPPLARCRRPLRCRSQAHDRRPRVRTELWESDPFTEKRQSRIDTLDSDYRWQKGDVIVDNRKRRARPLPRDRRAGAAARRRPAAHHPRAAARLVPGPPARLAALERRAKACRRCPKVAAGSAVIGSRNGPVPADLLFVAEAPGYLGALRTGVPLTNEPLWTELPRLLRRRRHRRRGRLHLQRRPLPPARARTGATAPRASPRSPPATTSSPR